MRLLLLASTLVTGSAIADVPRFAATCGKNLKVDTFQTGELRINGEEVKLIKRPDGQISANYQGAWVDITPRGDQPPSVTYTASDKTVGDCQVVSFDAEVLATGYHATAEVTCFMGARAPARSCPAGVKRRGFGSAMVTVTKPDGRTRTIFFEKGRATGYDVNESDPGKFSASKRDDLSIISIGEERYEIPDALPFGG